VNKGRRNCEEGKAANSLTSSIEKGKRLGRGKRKGVGGRYISFYHFPRVKETKGKGDEIHFRAADLLTGRGSA